MKNILHSLVLSAAETLDIFPPLLFPQHPGALLVPQSCNVCNAGIAKCFKVISILLSLTETSLSQTAQAHLPFPRGFYSCVVQIFLRMTEAELWELGEDARSSCLSTDVLRTADTQTGPCLKAAINIIKCLNPKQREKSSGCQNGPICACMTPQKTEITSLALIRNHRVHKYAQL